VRTAVDTWATPEPHLESDDTK